MWTPGRTAPVGGLPELNWSGQGDGSRDPSRSGEGGETTWETARTCTRTRYDGREDRD